MGNLLTVSAGRICKGWGSKCKKVLLKILILAAKSLFATFRIFTAEFLDSLLPLLEENAEAAAAAGILLLSFFPCPAWERVQEEGC